MRSVCVFCGSNPGRDDRFRQAAEAMGRELARRQIRLVFGGGRTGLMGALADAAMGAGGAAIGIIPHDLMKREVGHTGLTELCVVDSMHERKALMAEKADAFVAMPGGLGTLEELFEVWTWAQLGIHRKPIALLNVAGYYDPLIDFLDHAVSAEFVAAAHRDIMIVDADPAALLDKLARYEPPATAKWLGLEQS